MHLDSKDSTDAKGNLVIWDTNFPPAFVAGKFGNALSYGRCRINVPVSTQYPTTFTVACWVKANYDYDNPCSVRINPDDQAGMLCTIGFNVGYSAPGQVQILVAGSGNDWSDFRTLLGKIPLDYTWHHFAMTFNQGVITTYVDGVKYTSLTKNLAVKADYKRIGIMGDKSGSIDEVLYTEKILYTSNFTPPSAPYK